MLGMQEDGSSAAAAQARYCIAECHEATGDLADAIDALEQYAALTRHATPRAHARSCCKFGSLYYRMGEFAQVWLIPRATWLCAENQHDRPGLRSCMTVLHHCERCCTFFAR